MTERMKNRGKSLPELLAPAGNREALQGALSAGADAIYLGGTRFGARAYAENFTQEEIVRAIEDAHLIGAKIYLTANTLLKDSELGETVSFVYALWKKGLDGVIVQDLGLIKRLSETCPGLPLHASTQLSVTVPEGVRYLQRLGCRRVVPARELSLSEVANLKKQTGIEVEAFIHGAMCYSYSGRCLMSSFLGGRSGNRGRCAGTCRLPFRVLNEAGEPAGPDAGRGMYYPLSMRDLCTLELLPELIDAGIDSFKIEGRMKKPEYAAGVTAIYRKYLDLFAVWNEKGRKTPWKIAEEDLEKLRSLYLRSELSTGYYHRRNGRDLLTIGTPGYIGAEDRLLEEIRTQYLSGLPKRKIYGEASARIGEPIILTVWDESGACVTVQGQTAQPATGRPLAPEEIRARLSKTGDSPFAFSELNVSAEEGIFLPVSAINALRRDALGQLREQILARQKPLVIDKATDVPKEGERQEKTDNWYGTETESQLPEEKPCALWADVCTLEQLDAAVRCGVEAVILEDPSLLQRQIPEKTAIYLAFPYIFRESSRKLLKDALRFAVQYCRGILVRTPDELSFVTENGYSGRILADSSLYAWNKETQDILIRSGCSIVLPLELSLKDMQESLREDRPTAGSSGEGRRIPSGRVLLPVYGRAPLMVSAGCVRETEKSCPLKKSGNASAGSKNPSEQENGFYWMLEDRKRKQFPVRFCCAHCYNVIYNSLPTSLHKFLQKSSKRDPFLGDAVPYMLVFTTENGRETEECLKWFAKREGELPFQEFTNGHSGKSAL